MWARLISGAFWHTLVGLTDAERLRDLTQIYSNSMMTSLTRRHFPWLFKEASTNDFQAWPDICIVSDPLQPGINLTWQSLRDMYLQMEQFHGNDLFSKRKSSEPHTSAAFEDYLHLKRGQLMTILDLLTGFRRLRNPMLRICPAALLSAFIVRARFNFFGISTWEDADRVVAALAAVSILWKLLAINITKAEIAFSHEYWSFTHFTKEHLRSELLCRLNQFDMPYLSNDTKAHMVGLQSVVKETTGYDVSFCGGAGMQGGSMYSFQSLITQSAANTYCEVGFNWGASALLALCTGVRVFSWELDAGDIGAAYVAAMHLKDLFGDRFQITFGDSRLTLPSAGHVLSHDLCNIVFIDGSHDPRVVKSDLLNFVNVSMPHAVYVLDDCWADHYTGHDWSDSIYDVASWAAQSPFFENQLLATNDGFCILRHAQSSHDVRHT